MNGSGSDQEEGVVCLHGSLINSIGHSFNGHCNE